MGTSSGGGSTSSIGVYELVDNADYGKHGEALKWMAQNYSGPLNVATGYVGLEGLDALVKMSAERGENGRLLIGAEPSSEGLTGPTETVSNRLGKSVAALRRERDLSAFPAARRAVLERVSNFIQSDKVEVRRYARQFLHGKAYIIGELGDASLPKPGAALVSSANLTAAGLFTNLELGMVHYQPHVIKMALVWYQHLWDNAEDYKAKLLDMLLPPPLESDPQTVFLRALLELYEEFDQDQASTTHGHHTLAAFQQAGLDRAKRILERHGGVLYADGVGMGKTEIGIELIREHTQKLGHHVLIISPAQLRNSLWKRRLREENLPGEVVSYQELARDRQLSGNLDKDALMVNKDVYRLVVVDEAHVYRSADNKWYSALDRLMGGTKKSLLLLTATPVNNSLWDLHNLFLLFARHDGAFADKTPRIPSLRKFFDDAGASDSERLSETKLFPLVDALTVRRDRTFVEKEYPEEMLSGKVPVRFPKPDLHERRYDLDMAYPGIVQDMATSIDSLTMARYRPSSYLLDEQEESGSEATLAGLIKSQMLKRFESSWHAALKTARRMLAANAAMVHALAEMDAVPSSKIIKDLAGDGDAWFDSDTIDQVLEDSDDWIPAEEFNERLLPDVRKDMAILEDMITKLKRLEGGPDPKLEAFGSIMADTPSEKVAIFTAFRDTAEYLKERIEADPGLVGDRKWISVIGSEASPDTRSNALERFCPESAGGSNSPRPPGDEVDALISTDILSEGQNLQQAQAVLSFDMPWNPQRVVQRNGRIIRLGSKHEKAYLYTLLPKQGDLDKLLQLEAKIRAKIMAANAAVGMETPVLADVSPVSRIYNDLSKFTERLSSGDATLLDDEEAGGSAFAGEMFRSRLQRAAAEGEIKRLRGLPWGIGAAFARASSILAEPAVFFACRTRNDERYWRMVLKSGTILYRDDLPMLRVIDPQDKSGVPIPADLDLEGLFDVAASDICDEHNSQIEGQSTTLPASQRWALSILRNPDAPDGENYDDADSALSVGRNVLVKRELSRLRREYEDGLSLAECAKQIVGVVKKFGLQPVKGSEAARPISKNDVGVVCYQVVLPIGESKTRQQ